MTTKLEVMKLFEIKREEKERRKTQREYNERRASENNHHHHHQLRIYQLSSILRIFKTHAGTSAVLSVTALKPAAEATKLYCIEYIPYI